MLGLLARFVAATADGDPGLLAVAEVLRGTEGVTRGVAISVVRDNVAPHHDRLDEETRIYLMEWHDRQSPTWETGLGEMSRSMMRSCIPV